MPDHSHPGVSLELQGLTKRYGPTDVVQSIDLKIQPGEFVTLLGPSGSGKTTTLSMIAGFTQATAGEILLGGRSISALPTHRRNIGMVFQNYALFPHMTAAENIAYPLKRRKMSRAAVKERVAQALALVHLEGFGDRHPRQLSGGQQQRVALARAVVFDPPLLLMDEPLGALDKNLRDSLQGEIRRIHRELGVTVVLVTHDQEEALTLSDRIAVFNDGKIEQCSTGEDLYRFPATRFVADFLGESNILRGGAEQVGDRVLVTIGDRKIEVQGREGWVGDRADVLLRPEACRVRSGGIESKADAARELHGVVADVVYLGATRRVEIDVVGHGRITVREPATEGDRLRPGDEVTVSWDLEHATLLLDSANATEKSPEPVPA